MACSFAVGDGNLRTTEGKQPLNQALSDQPTPLA
jgi:hypothetical protein